MRFPLDPNAPVEAPATFPKLNRAGRLAWESGYKAAQMDADVPAPPTRRDPTKYYCATCRLVLERADVETHTDRYHAVLAPSGRLEELDATKIAADAARLERWWR